VFALRCTKKLLGRLPPGSKGEDHGRGSDTRLGDWTAHLFFTGRQQIVLGVNNKTLLPVLLPIAPNKTFLPRFAEAAGEMLMAIGIEDRQAVLAEMRAMDECIVAPTNDRRVLGTINDFGRTLDIVVERHPLPEAALLLATIPCSPIGMEYPKDVARGLFGQVVQNPTRAPLRLVKG
jgi:hypothetical protein